MISVSSNASKVAAGVDILQRNLHDTIVRMGIWKYAQVLRSGARVVHRHKRRTGKLERSIKIDFIKDGAVVYADDTYADYAKYVHMGQRSWAPDQFIFDSHDRNEKILDQLIDKAIDDAFRKVGF